MSTSTDLGEGFAISFSQKKDRSGLSRGKKLYEIDYIGNESFVASQGNVLMNRSVEPFGSHIGAQLSARGLHHRHRDYFTRDLRDSTAIIRNIQKEDKGKKGGKPSAQLLAPHFQRAVALERLEDNTRALKDYDVVLKIDPNNPAAYFNRSSIHLTQGNDDLALKDLNRAIKLDPMNLVYRNNKARILRKKGKYMEAIEETCLYRAIETQPEYVAYSFEQGEEPLIDSNSLKKIVLPKDPVVVALSKPKEDRRPKDMVSVCDFIRGINFFAAFKNDEETLMELANNVELCSYPTKGEFIFEEGMLGEHFYMILDGEVSIVKCKKNSDGEILHTNVLVKLFRRQSFGETALETKGGARSAGALVSQKNTHLLSLHIDVYKKVVGAFKRHIRSEVRLVLSSCPAFSEFSPEALDSLAACAVMRNYSSNKEILREGDESKYLYVVKQGLVKLIKRLKKPKVKNIKVFTPYSGKVQKAETPGLWVLEKSYTAPTPDTGKAKQDIKNRKNTMDARKGSLFPNVARVDDDNQSVVTTASVESSMRDNETEFTVGVIASGQIFGELAVLNPQEDCHLTAITTTPSEVFLLEGATVLALGAKYSTVCMNSLMESTTLHNPPQEKLGYFFRAKYVQERQMKDMLNLMKTETK